MWYDNSVMYQIYPLGFCGAPPQNDGVKVSRLRKVIDWIPHLKKMNVGQLYFCPLFDSDAHGYDTRDFRRLDPRLGDNQDLKDVCAALREAGIRVVFDAVFNHVGRGFKYFENLREKKWDSPYRDWFNINFGADSNYGDGFWYEGWEGHYELVKLNLRNKEVVDYLLDCVDYWVEEFGIDGLRLDVAYMVDRDFLRALRRHCDERYDEFFLVGEIIHGNYNDIVNPEMCHSATNYECARGLTSSFNSMNLFEIGHSLHRQFSDEPWALYRGLQLISFVDNHDISRAASMLKKSEHLLPLYGIMFGMPGIPCMYYGSEWGAEGDKAHGDDSLRPSFDAPLWNDLTDFISHAAGVRSGSKALTHGNFKIVLMTNEQLIFQRQFEDERVLIAVNASDSPATLHFDAGCGMAVDLLTDRPHDFGGGSTLKPFGCEYWLMER
ncbi:MAG: alpha-amylase family glycosyl hydrolase [Fastidiosipilaceae bacterium]|jgi:cyclomaltodextrinase